MSTNKKQEFDVNKRDEHGNTVLHFAVASPDFDIESIQNLIDLGAEIDAKNNNDDTPLHLACKGHYTEKFQCLQNNGADIFALNKQNLVPIELACGAGSSVMIEYLITEGVDKFLSTQSEEPTVKWLKDLTLHK